MQHFQLNSLRERHPLAGTMVKVHPAPGTEFENLQQGANFLIEDWYENVNGELWKASARRGIWAAVHYATRATGSGLPHDDEVVYGHIGELGYLVHVSELEQPQSNVTAITWRGDVYDDQQQEAA